MYLKVSDRLIEQASKEDLAETARVLALHLAHYQKKYEPIPVQDSLKLMLTETIDDSQAGALADGFEVLIEVIRAVATPVGAHAESQAMRSTAMPNCSSFNSFF